MTMWFERKPGDLLSPSTEEEGWAVVLPPELDPRRRQLKVLAHRKAPCPARQSGPLGVAALRGGASQRDKGNAATEA